MDSVIVKSPEILGGMAIFRKRPELAIDDLGDVVHGPETRLQGILKRY